MITRNQDRCYECICYSVRRCELYYVCTYTGVCIICSFVFAKNFFKKRGAFHRGLLVRGAIGQGADVRGLVSTGGGGGGHLSGGQLSRGRLSLGKLAGLPQMNMSID